MEKLKNHYSNKELIMIWRKRTIGTLIFYIVLTMVLGTFIYIYRDDQKIVSDFECIIGLAGILHTVFCYKLNKAITGNPTTSFIIAIALIFLSNVFWGIGFLLLSIYIIQKYKYVEQEENS